MMLMSLFAVAIAVLLWIAILLRQLIGEIQTLRIDVRATATWAQAVHQLAMTVRDQYFPLKY